MFYVGAAAAAPRSIPWNCDDWQPSPAVADADDERVSVILESLAANRGKTIYCAIDQSDTFTKAETWAAGRHRNERDDTVYFGESGNFRGFLSAQEGYLTDGESGVTGVSRDLIFEFPREQRRGKKTITKRMAVPADNSRRLWTPWEIQASSRNSEAGAKNAILSQFNSNQGNFDWQGVAETAADTYCQNAKYQRATRVSSGGETVVYSSDQDIQLTWYRYNVRKARTWSATCEKKVRVRRR